MLINNIRFRKFHNMIEISDALAKILVISLIIQEYIVTVNGQCNADRACFTIHVGCKIVAVPFERQTPVSCQQCMDACLSRLNGPAPYCCQSGVYDCVHQTCDLFAVSANGYRPRLVPCPNFFYFEPTRNPQCLVGGLTTPPPTVATTLQPTAPPDCPAGQSPVMITFKNSQSNSITGGPTFPASSQDSCMQYCQKNQDNNGKVVTCKTAQFLGGQCTLSSSAPIPNSPSTLQSSQGAYYYEKQCLPSNFGCTSILMDPKHMLVGFNAKTLDSPSYSDCLQQCINAQASFGFQCSSGMYYSDTTSSNCILNSESAQTQPDKYISSQDPVTYFEPRCAGNGGGAPIPPQALLKKSSAFQDEGLLSQKWPQKLGKWTLWSECDSSKTERIRYQNCFDRRITKCPNETESCGKNV